MLPIILISNNKKTSQKFINNQIKKNRDIIYWLAPEKKEFSINQIKNIIHEISISQPYRRIYVLEDFDSASIEAQNSFLKTLEESNNKVQYYLIVKNIYQILPTILSRASIVNLLSNEKKKIDIKIYNSLEKIINQGQINEAFNANFISTSREDTINIVIQIMLFFQSRLKTDKRAANILKEILKVNNLLINNNLNHQLSLDHILIYITYKYHANHTTQTHP